MYAVAYIYVQINGREFKDNLARSSNEAAILAARTRRMVECLSGFVGLVKLRELLNSSVSNGIAPRASLHGVRIILDIFK